MYVYIYTSYRISSIYIYIYTYIIYVCTHARIHTYKHYLYFLVFCLYRTKPAVIRYVDIAADALNACLLNAIINILFKFILTETNANKYTELYKP